MTIFRIDIEDEAKLVTKKLRVKNPELEKALKELKKIDEFRKALDTLKTYCDGSVKSARNVYTIADKALKQKGLSKDDEGELTHVRKVAYDFTVKMKKLGFI